MIKIIFLSSNKMDGTLKIDKFLPIVGTTSYIFIKRRHQ